MPSSFIQRSIQFTLEYEFVIRRQERKQAFMFEALDAGANKRIQAHILRRSYDLFHPRGIIPGSYSVAGL